MAYDVASNVYRSRNWLMEIGPTRKPRALMRVPHRALRWSLLGARRAGGPITNPLFFWVLEDNNMTSKEDEK
jgi:hypothetical protein